MLFTRKLIQQSLPTVRRFSVGSRLMSTQKSSKTGRDKPVVVAQMNTSFVGDRAGSIPLNMVLELNEVASFHMKNQPIGEVFRDIKKVGLISVVKMQEIKIFPEFYNYWKPYGKFNVHLTVHDVGSKSFNVQFDTYDETNSVILNRNIRGIVVCNLKLKPSPIPKDALEFLNFAAFHKERHFIPQPFKTKPDNRYETNIMVMPSDLDTYYHVNQANYLKFILDASVGAARNGAYKSLKQDIAFARVDHIVLDYERELCLDDNVNVETWEDEEHAMKLCFELSTAGKTAFQGSISLQEPLIKLSDKAKREFPRAEEF